MVTIIQILVALAFHIIDFGSGLVVALKKKCLKSSKMRDGLFKKMGFVFCYVVALIIDNYGTYIGFTIGVDVLPPIISFAVLTELISIVENISKINPNLLPEKLLSFFHIETK